MYTEVMPKLWNETIEAHRAAVREAVLDTTAALVAEQGLAAVTMSEIAEKTGIGRATLYKYFPDPETILIAWHERQIAGHLASLVTLADQVHEPGERLETVLQAYALHHQRRVHRHRDEPRGTELAAFLHRDEHLARAWQQLHAFIRDLVTEGAEAGNVRQDVAPVELASYCLHALTAASSLPSEAAVRRLVSVTLVGLRPAH
jgi:AcrR family transcriptional regulator